MSMPFYWGLIWFWIIAGVWIGEDIGYFLLKSLTDKVIECN